MQEAIVEVNHNDILLGRGGKNNQHSGNEQLREIALLRCEEYKKSSKRDKALLAMQIVEEVRSMKPPGRFLKRDAFNNWVDVCDKAAKEKVGQVIRDALVARFGRTGWYPESSDSIPIAKPAVVSTTKKRSKRNSSNLKAKKTAFFASDSSDESYTDEPSGMVEVKWKPLSKVRPEYHSWSKPKTRRTCTIRLLKPNAYAEASEEIESGLVELPCPLTFSPSPLQSSRKRLSPSDASPARYTKRRSESVQYLPTPPRINSCMGASMYTPSPTANSFGLLSRFTGQVATTPNPTEAPGDNHLIRMFEFEFNNGDPVVDGQYNKSGPNGAAEMKKHQLSI